MPYSSDEVIPESRQKQPGHALRAGRLQAGKTVLKVSRRLQRKLQSVQERRDSQEEKNTRDSVQNRDKGSRRQPHTSQVQIYWPFSIQYRKSCNPDGKRWYCAANGASAFAIAQQSEAKQRSKRARAGTCNGIPVRFRRPSTPTTAPSNCPAPDYRHSPDLLQRPFLHRSRKPP